MIRVTVELIPYGVGKPQKLGEMTIANDVLTSLETDGSRGSYNYKLYGKRNRLASGRVENWPRLSKNVWYLVGKCLRGAGYA